MDKEIAAPGLPRPALSPIVENRRIFLGKLKVTRLKFKCDTVGSRRLLLTVVD